jgi:hypothetical protein
MVGEPGESGSAMKGVEMKKRGITIRFGPLGLSLLAAGVTAVGLAAVSLADSGGGSEDGNGVRTFEMPAPPGGGAGVTIMGPDLSAEDRQKLEDFRKCMEENGAPGLPDPGEIHRGDAPPKLPSAEDREKLEKAFETCKEKLPEDLRKAGPPEVHGFRCGPAPGDAQRDQDQNQDQSDQSATQSSGSAT